MKKREEFKDGKTLFGNGDLMKGIGERLNTKSLSMSSLFSFEMLWNSTTLDCLWSSNSCFIFSLTSNSFLSFSSLTFLRLSFFASSSPSLFFFSFCSYASLSFLFLYTQLFKIFFFSLLFILSKLFKFCLVSFMLSLSLCSHKSKSKLCLKSFSSLENLARFWMNASPMSMKSSILDCCSLVILNEGEWNVSTCMFLIHKMY